jgi:hypothetical protein
MGLFEIMLGIDKAARDTGKRRTLRLLATDSLTAAIQAEAMIDATLNDPRTEYSHAMACRQINGPAAMVMALAA